MTQPKTLDEIRDYMATRQGWKRYGRGWWRDNSARGGNNYEEHPIPATLDAIAGLLPSGWRWSRKLCQDGGMVWIATNATLGKSAVVYDTFDELLDRATLAYLAQIEQDKEPRP